MAKYDLKNKNVIITGASGGIGRELALRMIKNYGCTVIGIGRNATKMEAVKNEAEGKFSYELFDVSDKNAWADFAKKLESNGFIPDMLINNAGYLLNFAKAERHTANQAENITAVNYFASIYSFNALLPLLKKSDAPAVVNISSSAALAPVVGTALYSASKAALKIFTEVLQCDYASEIYVAGVYPGFTKTDIFSHQNANADVKIINKFCAPVGKTVKKMLKKLRRKKKRIILGADAKAMNFFYKIFPNFTSGAIRNVLKKTGLDLFSDVF